jgi:hypothetical protein
MNFFQRVQQRVRRENNLRWDQRQVEGLAREFDQIIPVSEQPVIFFNASTRLSGLSQNAGFSLVSSLALRRAGQPVIHFVCQQGLSHCVLGTDKHHPQTPPPCAECMRTSHRIFAGAQVQPFTSRGDEELAHHMADLPLQALLELEWQEIPLGKIVLPSLRWILRVHHLQDDENTRYLAREYMLSALNVIRQFESLIERVNPSAVVVFNGMFYPEASVRWIAQHKGLPVYSHEVGMLPLSAFFTAGEATAYPVRVDELSASRTSRTSVWMITSASAPGANSSPPV